MQGSNVPHNIVVRTREKPNFLRFTLDKDTGTGVLKPIEQKLDAASRFEERLARSDGMLG
jgi:hypothetical protein